MINLVAITFPFFFFFFNACVLLPIKHYKNLFYFDSLGKAEFPTSPIVKNLLENKLRCIAE